MSNFKTLVLLLTDMVRDFPRDMGYHQEIQSLTKFNDFKSTLDYDIGIGHIKKLNDINELQIRLNLTPQVTFTTIKECLAVFLTALEDKKKLIIHQLMQEKVDCILAVVQEQFNAEQVYPDFYDQFKGQDLRNNEDYSQILKAVTKSSFVSKHLLMYSLMRVMAFQENPAEHCA